MVEKNNSPLATFLSTDDTRGSFFTHTFAVCPLDNAREVMLKLPDGEMWMSMSDAALSQPDTAPSMVATWKPFCVHFWSRRLAEVSR